MCFGTVVTVFQIYQADKHTHKSTHIKAGRKYSRQFWPISSVVACKELDHLVHFRSIQADTQSSCEAKRIRGTGVNMLSHGSNALCPGCVAPFFNAAQRNKSIGLKKYLGCRVYWKLGLALNSHCASRYERSILKCFCVFTSVAITPKCAYTLTRIVARSVFNWSVVRQLKGFPNVQWNTDSNN